MQDHIKKEVVKLASALVAGTIAPDAFYQSLTRTITEALGCSRASLWQYTNAFKDEVVCLDLYDRGEEKHYEGIVLREDDFGPYFEAMRSEGLIVASNARSHEATSCFNELYFEPNGIYSLLDVGIKVNGVDFGLFCCENVTFIKEWSTTDVDFLRATGTLCGMALKKIHG
jgi:GAF domain-containing protein